MAFVHPGDGALDYFPCQYGRSRLTFRGPRRDLRQDYVAVLGGTETFGRFVLSPYPSLIEERLEVAVANLGQPNAGPDVYLADPGAMEVAAAAHVVIVQVMGAQNLTNRFYTVHPRRNDRFVAATPPLRAMYREVDFTEIHFTRHLVQTLWSRDPGRFALVAQEMKRVWVERMRSLLQRLPERRILLWTSSHAPPDRAPDPTLAPALVDRGMIAQLLPDIAAYVEHIASPAALNEGLSALRFLPPEEPAAQVVPTAAMHHEAAEALLPVIERLF